MKKQTLLTKTLLLAAGLCAGVSAWADTYEVLYGLPTYDTDGVTITAVTAQTDFTGDDNEKTDITVSDANGTNCDNAMPIGGSVLYIGKNSNANWRKNFSSNVTEGKVYFACNYRVGSNNNQRIRIVDSNDYVIFGSATNTTNGNSNQTVATICGTGVTGYCRQARACHYGVKSVCIDLDARKVTYELIISSGDNSYSTASGAVDLPSTVTNVKGLYACKPNYDNEVYFDNVLLYSVVSSEPTYTINYKDGETVVKTVGGREAVGTVITADAAITGNDENRYLITGSETPTMTITAGENVLNVPVRATYKATLKVTTTINGTDSEQEIALEETDGKDCSWSYFYPLYTQKDGVYYKVDASTYGWTGTFVDGDVIEKNVSYPDADNDVIFFTEGTDCSYLVLSTTNNPTYSSGNTMTVNTSANHSNARNRGIGVGNLDAGYYTMIANITKANKRALAIRINNGGTNEGNMPLASITGNSTGVQNAEFSLDATSAIVITGANSGDGTSSKSGHMEDFDYIIVKRVSVTPSVTDYATFSSHYALDFSSATGVKAYYASASDGSTVTMTKVTGAVKAGTALLLQKTTGDISIPTAADGTDLSATNLLKAGTGGAVKTEGNTHRYVLAGEGASTSFYELAESAAAVVIPEGKAYLEVVNAGARLSISFSDGETTGIANVEQPNTIADGVYNLNGQRIDGSRFTVNGSGLKPGLYIVNGKKVLVK
mgnify:CR=1 FL=1